MVMIKKGGKKSSVSGSEPKATKPKVSKAKAKTTAKAGKSASYLKRGAARNAAMKKEETKARLNTGGLFRFRLQPDTETQITFIDGELDSDGILDCPVVYEHTVQRDGRWRNFVCIDDDGTEPCPICETGDSPYLAGLFTIIDHGTYVSKDGKEFTNQKRLLVAKRTSLNMLQKYATKREGLDGCTFDVSRTGPKEAAIGNMFDFTEKRSLPELKKMYPKVEWTPANYEEECPLLTLEDLRALGFGIDPIGAEPTYHDDEGVDEEEEEGKYDDAFGDDDDEEEEDDIGEEEEEEDDEA